MVPPALPEPPERQEGAHHESHVEGETEQAVLTENLEVDTVRVEGLPEDGAVVDRPDLLGREPPEADAGEWSAYRDVPSGLEGLDSTRRGCVARLGRLLLGDGCEPNPKPLRGQGCGEDPDREQGDGETQSPGRAPDQDEAHDRQAQEGSARVREDGRDNGAAERDL